VWVARDFFKESIVAATTRQTSHTLVGDERNMPDDCPKMLSPSTMRLISGCCARFCCCSPRRSRTTAQGLLAGVPTMIVPFAFDQLDNADHARRLGTSRTLHQKNYSVDKVVKDLAELMGKPAYAQRAKVISDRLNWKTVLAASDFIEGF